MGWGRFCSHCGKDLSSAHSSEASSEELLKAVQVAADGVYDVLGGMQRSGGEGVVYFARELDSGRLVALRLTREQDSDGSESFALDVTHVIKPLVASLGATYSSPTPAMQAASVPPARAAAPSTRSPQPAARSPTPPSVIVPDFLSEAEQPPAPKKRLPVVPIAVLTSVLVVVGAMFVFSNSRRGAPDPSQDPATNVVVPPAPAPPAPPPVAAVTVDSGAISIGSLPTGARVTLNGKPMSDRRFSLLPGQYQLVASAPGYRAASQRVEVTAGDTFTWSPTMQAVKVVAARTAHTPAPRPVASASPNCLNAYSDKNWAAALPACTREANAGNQPAQRNLGIMYDQGLGIAKDPRRPRSGSGRRRRPGIATRAFSSPPCTRTAAACRRI